MRRPPASTLPLRHCRPSERLCPLRRQGSIVVNVNE
jgi:hypothetical protein